MVDIIPAVESPFRLAILDELPLRPPTDFVVYLREPLPAGTGTLPSP